MVKYRHLMLVFVLLASLPLKAQHVQDQDTVVMPKWEPHMSVTTGFVGNSYGDNRLYTSIAPSVTFRPTKKLSFVGGFSVMSDMGLDPNYLSKPVRSLAPRRANNGGTGVASAYVEADYQVNDRLWLAASLYHVGGQYAPFFGPANGSAFDVSATALSAEAAFRFSDNNYLRLSFTVVRDHTGMMPYMIYDTWMNHGWGRWSSFSSPTDLYRLMGTPMYYGFYY